MGEQLDLPASSITEAVIDEHLRRARPRSHIGADPGAVPACNLARYHKSNRARNLPRSI